MYDELKDLGYVIMWSIVALTIAIWIIHEIKETAFQSGYWKGRKDGFDMHRRITDAKRDQVFNLEEYRNDYL